MVSYALVKNTRNARGPIILQLNNFFGRNSALQRQKQKVGVRGVHEVIVIPPAEIRA